MKPFVACVVLAVPGVLDMRYGVTYWIVIHLSARIEAGGVQPAGPAAVQASRRRRGAGRVRTAGGAKQEWASDKC